MRKFLLSAFVAFGMLSASAANGFNCLKVNLNDGSKVDIVLSDDLKVSFTDNDLVAHSANVDVTVAKSDISYFEHLYDPEASVSEIAADAAGMTREGNTLNFAALPEGSVVAVYAASGVCVSTATVSGDHSLSLDGLTPGVYVVTVNKMSYKVNVR